MTTDGSDRPVVMTGTFAIAAVLVGMALFLNKGSYSIAAGAIVATLIVVVSLVIFRRLALQDDDESLFTILTVAIVFKLAASLARYWMVNKLYGGGGDSTEYDRLGWEFAQQVRAGQFFPELVSSATGTDNVVRLTGYIYAITGRTPFGAFFIYSWLAFWGCVLCWRGLMRAFPESDHRRYMLLVLFWPSLLFWPSSTGKDAVMVFVLGVAAYGASWLLAPRPNFWGAPILAGGVWGMMQIRTHVALMAVLSIVVATTFAVVGGTKVEEARGRGRVVRVIALGGLVLLAVAAMTQTSRFFSETAGEATSTSEALRLTRERTEQGGSAFEPIVVSNPAQVPAATVSVLFRPFPWEAHNAGSLISAAEAGLIGLLFLLSWRRLRRWPGSAWRRPILIYALVYCLMFVVAFSSIGNAGILARQRSQMLPLLFVAFAVPTVRWWRETASPESDHGFVGQDLDPARHPMSRDQRGTDSLGTMSEGTSR